MREIATKKKGHVLHYITSFCVVFRLSTLYFWLAGQSETKQVVNRMSKWVGEGGSWRGHEFLFFSRLRRSCARLDKTTTLRRLSLFILCLLINNYTKHKLTIIRCQSQRLICRRSESYNVLYPEYPLSHTLSTGIDCPSPLVHKSITGYEQNVSRTGRETK